MTTQQNNKTRLPLKKNASGNSNHTRVISRSEQYVSNRIQLLRAPKEIIDQISQNKLKISHALEVLNLCESEQKIKRSIEML